MDVLNYKCKSCGAVLHFSPKAQKWICNYCGSEHTIQELNELYGKENLSNYNENYVSYQCQNCGAEIVTDKNTSATFCLYCNSHSIIKNRISGEFKPDKIIPFKISKEEAIKRIKKYNYLLGFNKNILSDEIILQNIKPLYIPCYLFSMDTCVDVSYLEKKLGQFGVAEDYKIQKRLEARFENIPVDGLTQFESKLLNPIEPFDYSEMVEFSPKYLAGYFADRYDSVNEFVENEATKRVMTTLDINWEKIIFPQDILGKFNNIKCEKTCFNKTYQYVLLPIWVLNVEFEGKKYPIIVNGQTGKIAGEIKNDYRKLIKVFFIVLAISILIMMSEFRGTHLKFSTYLSVCLQPSVLITAIIYIVSRNRQKKIKRKESAGEYVDSSSIKVQTIKEEKIL